MRIFLKCVLKSAEVVIDLLPLLFEFKTRLLKIHSCLLFRAIGGCGAAAYPGNSEKKAKKHPV